MPLKTPAPKRPPSQSKRQSPLLAFFHQHFANDRLGNKRNPVDELVFIILSKQTQEKVYIRAYKRLKKHFRTWNTLADAQISTVAELIREAGFADQRAAQLVAMAQEIRNRFGHVSLSALSRLSTEQAEAVLCSLPGVGKKIAKCVLMYSLGRQALPIDVHTLRVAQRIGLVGSAHTRARALSTQVALEASIPPGSWYAFHVGAVRIGRQWCTENNPRCECCPISKWCNTGRSYLHAP